MDVWTPENDKKFEEERRQKALRQFKQFEIKENKKENKLKREIAIDKKIHHSFNQQQRYHKEFGTVKIN